jgi:uncharacterized protein (DUF302 family)
MVTYFSTKLKMPFDVTTRRLKQSLHRQGFSAITTIDVKDTLKRKLDIAFRKYRILAVCDPEIAYRVISLESHLGLMAPCNIVVQEHENGEVEVSATNPMLTIEKEAFTPQIAGIAREISNRLGNAIDNLHAIQIESPHPEVPRWFSRPHGQHPGKKIQTRWKNTILG